MQGFITKIDARDTKFGTYYDIYFDGKKAGAGKFPPKGVQANDYVEYELEKDDKGYDRLRAGTLRKLEAPQGVKAPAAPAASTIGLDRQDVISRQAALNSAIEFVTLLQTAGAIPVGKTANAAKTGDKLEAILMSYVQKFYKMNTQSDYVLTDDEAVASAQNWDEQE